jgi:hypothetical protein
MNPATTSAPFRNWRKQPDNATYPMSKEDGKTVKAIKRLMFGVHSMKLVISSCRYYENLKDANLDLLTILSAGIATVYASPFTSSQGLGPLDKRYQEFPDKENKQAHDDLMGARHEGYAHRDLTGEHATMHQIQVVVCADGSIDLRTQLSAYSNDVIPHIINLCVFQDERFTKDAHALLLGLQAKLKKPVGTYILGENYP